MQHGSIMLTNRQCGTDVWEFRWREPGPLGKRKHRRMVIGSVDDFPDESAARQQVSALGLEINLNDVRIKWKTLTVSELVDHYRQRELKPDTVWKTHSTKVTYQGYLNKWILPRWGACTLARMNAGEVELSLRSIPLARSSCAKIRNLMSTVFNHQK
jgi:integrase